MYNVQLLWGIWPVHLQYKHLVLLWCYLMLNHKSQSALQVSMVGLLLTFVFCINPALVYFTKHKAFKKFNNIKENILSSQFIIH